MCHSEVYITVVRLTLYSLLMLICMCIDIHLLVCTLVIVYTRLNVSRSICSFVWERLFASTYILYLSAYVCSATAELMRTLHADGCFFLSSK